MIEFLLGHGSYLLIITVLVLTGSGLPIPEEVPIIAAGILASHGRLDPYWAMAACLFGALAGDCVMYWIGYHFGRSVVREHPYWAHFVKPERDAQIERMIEEHGLKVFFLARFLVGLRSPVYLSAGILRVPFRRFLLIDSVCATTVIGLFFVLSYRYGQTITGWIQRAEFGLWGIVLLVVPAVAFFYWRRHRRNRTKAELEPQTEQGDSSALQDEPEEKANKVEHVA